ncbi:MAG: hypothetical protein ACPGSO_00635 [Vicingaceae bacterium]
MAKDPAVIKTEMDNYLNDGVPEESIDPSEVNQTFTDILDNLIDLLASVSQGLQDVINVDPVLNGDNLINTGTGELAFNYFQTINRLKTFYINNPVFPNSIGFVDQNLDDNFISLIGLSDNGNPLMYWQDLITLNDMLLNLSAGSNTISCKNDNKTGNLKSGWYANHNGTFFCYASESDVDNVYPNGSWFRIDGGLGGQMTFDSNIPGFQGFQFQGDLNAYETNSTPGTLMTKQFVEKQNNFIGDVDTTIDLASSFQEGSFGYATNSSNKVVWVRSAVWQDVNGNPA